MIGNKKVLAVVLSFKREQNLPDVVSGLKKQSFIDDVLIIHNHPSKTVIDECYNIISDINFGCLIRHQIAYMFDDYGYFVFSDDDFALMEDVSSSVESAIEKVGETSIIGIYGLNLNMSNSNSPYSSGKHLGLSDALLPVDVVKGRFHIMTKRNVAIVASSMFNTKYLRQEDDIRANISVQHYHREPSYLFPVGKKTIQELDASHALQSRGNHFNDRNCAIKDGIALGWTPNN